MSAREPADSPESLSSHIVTEQSQREKVSATTEKETPMTNLELFQSLLQCTRPPDFEKVVYGRPLSNDERKSFQAKLTHFANSKGLTPDKKIEIHIQLAVLDMSSSDPLHALANVGEALQAGGRAGKDYLLAAFANCWPLTQFVILKHEADLASSSLMGMGFVINKLNAEFKSKPELADTWPFVLRASNKMKSDEP